jgi:polyferredoxin
VQLGAAQIFSFRMLHLMAIGVVAAQAWLGQVCPLTTLESWLRVQSGAPAYEKGFIEHWVQWLIFHDAPSWVFTAIYNGFAMLVIATWLAWPPVLRRRRQGDA